MRVPIASPVFSCSPFFFNDTATTEIYTLSLHDALPILIRVIPANAGISGRQRLQLSLIVIASGAAARQSRRAEDRKSTRLNSSHSQISYAVFCLKKKTTLPSAF